MNTELSMKPHKILLDSNIYTELSQDTEICLKLSSLIARGRIKIIISPIVRDELNASPFKGVPDFFPTETILEAVAVIGYARIGRCRISDGKTYLAHKGKSNKAKDAIIAETVLRESDVFVSSDKRCRSRLKKITSKCLIFTYNEFKNWLNKF